MVDQAYFYVKPYFRIAISVGLVKMIKTLNHLRKEAFSCLLIRE